MLHYLKTHKAARWFILTAAGVAFGYLFFLVTGSVFATAAGTAGYAAIAEWFLSSNGH